MTTSKEREEAASQLRAAFPPGSTARTILRHVSASGMTRWISVIGADDKGEPRDLTWAVARLLGARYGAGKHEGVKREGCGMDMGFDLVYAMSRTLYPDGFDCIEYPPPGDTPCNDATCPGNGTLHGPYVSGRRCPANDHGNGLRGWAHHRDGGYAVSHRWL